MSSNVETTKPCKAGQIWFVGVVESYGPVTRGKFTANVIRLFVEDKRNPKYSSTFFVDVPQSQEQKVTVQQGDTVELWAYAKSRLNREGDNAFPGFTLAFAKVLSSSAGDATHKPQSSAQAEKQEAPADSSDPLPF